MAVLSKLEQIFGSLLIFVALAVIFTSLIAGNALRNFDSFVDIMSESLPRIIEENKEEFIKQMESQSSVQQINKQQLRLMCDQKAEGFTDEFCNGLDGMTEAEAKEGFINMFISQAAEDELKPQIEEAKQGLSQKLEELRIRVYVLCALIAGFVIYLLGVFFVFLSKRFDVKASLFYIGLKTGIVSSFISVSLFFVKSLTPEKIASIAKDIARETSAQQSDTIARVVIEMILDWFRTVVAPVVIIAVIVALVFFALAVVMFVLKRKKLKTKVVEESKLEKVIKKPVEVVKAPAPVKKKRIFLKNPKKKPPKPIKKSKKAKKK